MTFSEAQMTAVIDEINEGIGEMNEKLASVPGVVNNTVSNPLVLKPIADGIIWCAEKFIEIATGILEDIVELLEGAVAPIAFFFRSINWLDNVKAPASDVEGAVSTQALRAPLDWTGEGASRYTSAVDGQGPAAGQISSIGNTVAIQLGISAAAGLAFYVALGVILVKLILASIAAIAALGSAVFSWAGVLLIVEEAAVNTGLIIAAVSTLTAVLGASANAMVQIKSDASSGAAFPGGAWPVGTT